MRKHLVVVGVTASALLLAGGVAATSAGADENPDVPGLSFAWPALPGWSDFGGGSDGDDSGDDSDDGDGDGHYADDADDDGSDAGDTDDYDKTDMSDQDS